MHKEDQAAVSQPFVAPIAEGNKETIQELLSMLQKNDSLKDRRIIPQEKIPQSNAYKSPTPPKNEQMSLASELKIAQEERQKNLIFIKRSTMTLATLAASCYVVKVMKRQPQKRFISDAITASSLAWSACQGVTGCALVGFGYYQIHKLIYSGCVTEKEFNILQKAYNDDSRRIAKLITTTEIQSKAINDHACELDSIQSLLVGMNTTQKDLFRVVQAHAKNLNEERACIQRAADAIISHEQAINNHAKFIKQQNSASSPTVVKASCIVTPGFSEEIAATPLAPNYPNTDLRALKASTVSVDRDKKKCGFFSCCKEDSVAIKR